MTAAGTLWGPPPEFRPADAEQEAAVLRIAERAGREAERAAGASCRACGRCCDFPSRDYELFATALELEVVRTWADRHGLWDAERAAERVRGGWCPFWIDRRCAVHAARPVGCRLYFCTGGGGRRTEAAERTAGRALAQLAEARGRAWWYGPALLWFARNLT